MNLRITALVAIMIAFAVPANAQKIFKYLDKDGNTIYSQSLPPGIKGTEVHLRVQKVSAAAAREKLNRLTAKTQNSQQNSELSATQQSTSKAEGVRRKRNCEQARKNLEVLKSSARVQAMDAEGKLFYLDDDNKQARTAETVRQVSEFCK
jgi:hypothetical protein